MDGPGRAPAMPVADLLVPGKDQLFCCPRNHHARPRCALRGNQAWYLDFLQLNDLPPAHTRVVRITESLVAGEGVGGRERRRAFNPGGDPAIARKIVFQMT